MECGQIEKMLPDYLEQVLSPEEITQVEKHIASCAKCRTVFEDYREARLLVKNLEEVEPPPGFSQRIMVQVREEAQEKRGLLKKLFYPLHIKVPIQAIATVVIAVLAIQVYRSVEPQKAVIQLPPMSPPVASIPAAPKEDFGPEKKQKIVPSPAKEAPRAAEDIQVSKEGRSKDKETEPAPAAPALQKSQIQEEKIPIAPAQRPKKREAAKETEGGAFLDSKEAPRALRAAAPSPAMGIAAAKKAEAIDLKLRVNDVAISGKTVTTIIEDLGGSKIDRVPGEGLEVITANLQFIQLKELFKKLKIVGEIEEKPIPPAISEEFVALRIEIVKK